MKRAARWVVVAVLGLSAGTIAVARADPVLEHIEAGRWVEAETLLRGRLDAGDDVAAFDLLGAVLARQARHAEAAEAFGRAAALAPSDVGIAQRLARSLLETGEDERAVAALRRAAAHGVLERDLALKLAVSAAGAGEIEVAAVQLTSLIERYDSVRARLLLARLRSATGDVDGALTLLDRARTIAPHAEDVLRAYARTAVAAGRPLASLGALEPLLRMSPRESEYVYLAGIARLRLGDAAGAAEVLRRVRELPGPRALPLAALGLALNQLENYDEAREVLHESLQLDPTGVEALAALAETEEGAGNLDEAAALAERALAQRDDHPVANVVAGMVGLKRGDLTTALERLTRAVQVSPDSPKAHYQLSLVHSRLGDREAARAHLERYRAAQKAIADLRTPAAQASESSVPGGDD